ncbi:hypothetical protein CFC21_008462 [Triticum aestivum]|uniref:F-box domain-containing protein n=3 Tax=Triticum TaxID=4564 RepID=A0A9R0VC96_TRITD|nr:uncharacterized protein LOC123142196 [Triticum aestivum]KAF6991370.1 hypothetical protein CFC21_008462 [Triticum aestivum]VAH22025.1 unnamed protein product [Triticum turgidum subsp. durum]
MRTRVSSRSRVPPPRACTASTRRRPAEASFTLARRRRVDRLLRRQPRKQADPGEDRVSALPDDLLLLVLRRLDTRAALGAGLLSKRWAGLPRELPALDLRVSDVLPPRYRRWLLRYRDIFSSGTFALYRHRLGHHEFVPSMTRYERRAMRAFTSSVEGLLGSRARRRVSSLRLEFFITGNTGCVNRLISQAMDAWGVDDLEVIARPTFRQQTVHAFPSHGLCSSPRLSRLQNLKLGGCVIPHLLHEYHALTRLVLQDVAESPPAAYEGVFDSCPQLQVVHLKSCLCGGRDMVMVVDAPSSQIRELVVDKCEIGSIWLRDLPNLERLASLGTRLFFESTAFPCLRQWSLARCHGVDLDGFRQRFRQHLELDLFLGHTPDITDLIIRFTGPDRWIVPSISPSVLLPNLRRLLVADVPSSWDVSWPRLLFEMAPSLESFHIHIASCMEEPSPNEEISWWPTKFRQHRLKEFVMAGFEATERQIYLIKFVMAVCTALRHVSMFKNGHAQDKGHWEWEMVTQQHSWTEEDKDDTLNQIMGTASSTAAPVQLVLG